MHNMAREGDLLGIMDAMRNEKYNPLEGDEDGNNSLHNAAIGGHVAVVKYFFRGFEL